MLDVLWDAGCFFGEHNVVFNLSGSSSSTAWSDCGIPVRSTEWKRYSVSSTRIRMERYGVLDADKDGEVFSGTSADRSSS